MPDDIIDQEVAEQDDPKDETAAFNEDSDEKDEFGKDIDVKDEVDDEPEEKEVEEHEKKEEKAEEDEEEPEKEEPESEEDEDDDDIKRGKELIAKKEQEEAEQKEKEEAEKAEHDEPESADLRNEKFEIKDLETLHSHIPKNLLPKGEIELEDGTKLNFDEVVKDYPEMPMMIGAVANNMIRQLIDKEFLMSYEKFDQEANRFLDNYEKNMFVRTVTHPEYGVPNADEIAKSDEYVKWFKALPDSLRALNDSSNPWDHIRLLKRYINKDAIATAEKEVAEKETKRKAAKDTFDKVHKSTVKSKGKPQTKTSDSPSDEDEAFNSDEKDEDEFF